MPPIAGPSIPRLGYEVISKVDVATTRPALERARYRCECCPRDDHLRVVAGFSRGGPRRGVAHRRELVVLCPECRVGNGFQLVVAHRRARESVSP